MIAENFKTISENIRLACERSKRQTEEVCLVAVSKTKSKEKIMEAYLTGQRDFGENKVKELLSKKEELPRDIRWHMIGHLQSNKVRSLMGKTVLIHSIDSIRLSDCIDVESRKAGIVTEGLLEFNIAREESKYGFLEEELEEVLERCSRYRFLKIRGLMTVAPIVSSPEENRNVFRKLRKLAVDIREKSIDNVSMDFLSMGMTDDYTVAIEEGSNFVRVGTGLFGARNA